MTRHVVLMIDDDPDSYDRVRRYLDQELYDIRYTPDPYQGVELARQLKPDSIILDIRMPELDGYDVCRRLRNHEATQRTPIIIYSVLGDEDDAYIRSLDKGAHAVVQKEKLSRLGAALERFASEKAIDAPVMQVTSHMHKFCREGHELQIQGEAERVWLNGEERILRPKARKLLACLITCQGVLISSKELVEELYDEQERFSRGPGDIHRLISDLRAQVEPSPKRPIFIENVRRTGYRIIGGDEGM